MFLRKVSVERMLTSGFINVQESYCTSNMDNSFH